MKATKSSTSNSKEEARRLIARAVAREKKADAARNRARMAKLKYKRARKAFRQARKAAKQARKEAKVAVKTFQAKTLKEKKPIKGKAKRQIKQAHPKARASRRRSSAAKPLHSPAPQAP